MSELFKQLLSLGLGIALGWVGCMWWHGHLFGSDDAQFVVAESIEADRGITDAEATVEQGRERIRTVIRTVEVASETVCPPGAGAVSDGVADRLRGAYAEAGK